jgi:hypothetical protein
VEEAVANMNGLTFSQEEEETLLPLQQAWDLFTSSRLRDEVTVTADDGVTLHGYLYNEGSDITVVVLPRFDQDGIADFLPGVWLNEQTGCNLLLPDPRNHGESGGDYYGYGYLEQYDLDNWLDWAEETLGAQTFILWGEGSGANTILFAQQSGLLDSRVAFAVAESPIASLHEMAQRQIFKWYTVPAFPFLSSIEWKLARSEAGYTIQDLELADLLADGQGTIPVLFLESSQDEYILPEWSTTVYLSYNGEKELTYGGGTHGTVYAYRQDEIQSLLSSWCSLYVK